MAGILELDPATQGLLQAAFAGLKASGPSRMPTSLGQVFGTAGTAGLATYDSTKRLESDLHGDVLKQELARQAIARGKMDIALQNEIMQGQGGQGGMGGMLGNPDAMEQLGMRLSLNGHPGGAALIGMAEKIRKTRAGQEQLGLMKSSPAQATPVDTSQEGTGSFDMSGSAGPATAMKPGKAGIFSSMFDSPHVGSQAKQLQDLLDKSPTGSDPDAFRKEYDRLQGDHRKAEEARTARTERFSNQADMARLVASLRVPASEFSNVQPDGKGGFMGLSKRSGKMESIPTADGVYAPGVLSDEAKDAAAARYNLDGTLPPNLGRGTQGSVNTADILTRAAKAAAESGNSPEAQRVNQIANKANAQALGQLEKQRNLVLAFEKNALANADIALKESEKVDRVGSPAIDRWLQAGKKNVMGDVDVARLDTAIRTFVNEYAKVTTSVTGGGVTSDHARKEIDDLLKASMTKEQVRGVIDLMKQEMKNREKGYDDQVTELRGRMTGGSGGKSVLKFDAQGNPVK